MTDQPSQPYRSTPLFTQDNLPQALQREHRTKIGVWGLLCVTEGSIRFVHEDGRPPCIVTPQAPCLIEPDSPHHVELMGPVSLRVDFYDHQPVGRLP
ncbi:DUF1971 domain-containing protein [Sphingobium sp.]|uniref:DUF1971 domain-containing protein n=1 Tax=Sphingobium sp. TaxID=1912891 RepID=UPI003B3AEDC1